MTKEQRRWLIQHPEYEIVGAGGMGPKGQMTTAASNFSGLGALREDGTFVVEKVVPPAILVGIKGAPRVSGGGNFGA